MMQGLNAAKTATQLNEWLSETEDDPVKAEHSSTAAGPAKAPSAAAASAKVGLAPKAGVAAKGSGAKAAPPQRDTNLGPRLEGPPGPMARDDLATAPTAATDPNPNQAAKAGLVSKPIVALATPHPPSSDGSLTPPPPFPS